MDVASNGRRRGIRWSVAQTLFVFDGLQGSVMAVACRPSNGKILEVESETKSHGHTSWMYKSGFVSGDSGLINNVVFFLRCCSSQLADLMDSTGFPGIYAGARVWLAKSPFHRSICFVPIQLVLRPHCQYQPAVLDPVFMRLSGRPGCNSIQVSRCLRAVCVPSTYAIFTSAYLGRITSGRIRTGKCKDASSICCASCSSIPHQDKAGKFAVASFQEYYYYLGFTGNASSDIVLSAPLIIDHW